MKRGLAVYSFQMLCLGVTKSQVEASPSSGHSFSRFRMPGSAFCQNTTCVQLVGFTFRLKTQRRYACTAEPQHEQPLPGSKIRLSLLTCNHGRMRRKGLVRYRTDFDATTLSQRPPFPPCQH
ncbi:hypothetical protein B0T13DRAFT_22648 [Neurospora crassa]|nr:hypothetical protein B0T13DRAFT_22648 [Neurospora crassa]